MPLRVSPEVAAHLEAHSRAELVPHTARAAAANAVADGSPAAAAIPCHVQWVWAGALEGQEEQVQEPPDVAADEEQQEQEQEQEQRPEAGSAPRRSSRSASASRSKPQAPQRQQPKPLPALPYFIAQVRLGICCDLPHRKYLRCRRTLAHWLYIMRDQYLSRAVLLVCCLASRRCNFPKCRAPTGFA